MLSWIEINSTNVKHNFREFQKLVGASKVCPILKSNAYGHGLKEIFECLKSENPSWLGVNYVEEGIELRKLGYKGRILIVGPFIPSALQLTHQFQIDLFLGHQEGLDAWLSQTKKSFIHLEFDTGMGRQGFLPEDAHSIAQQLLPHKDLVKGLCMHFANVEDVTEHEYAKVQLERFESVKSAFLSHGFEVCIHAASSASTLILGESRFDLVRVGISSYGFWPSQATRISYKQIHGKLLDLKPVLSWKARITSINHVKQGDYIGYGCTYKARHNMCVGVVPVGYYEGYPRVASGSSAYVLIHGERCPIVGRICMNMMMVDMTDIQKDVRVDDLVTLIGQDGKEYISASDVANWSETIHYELVTRINPALERKILPVS